MKDYYKILGISEKVSGDAIEEGFRVSLLNAKARGRAWFEKYNDEEVNVLEAYKIIANPESRSAYDRKRSEMGYTIDEKGQKISGWKSCYLCGGPLPKWWEDVFYWGKNAHRKQCRVCGKCLTGSEDFWGKCSACRNEIWREKERRKEEKRVAREARDRLREYERWQVRKTKMDDYRKLRKEIEAMPQYEQWRQTVFAKFGKRCINDPSHQGNIEVDHHYKSFYAIIQKHGITNTMEAEKCTALWDVDNGVPLCKFCHNKTPSSIYRNIHKVIDEYEERFSKTE